MKGRPIRSIPECEAISTNVHFNMVNEKKFFKLFAALTKNCEENIFMLNKIRNVIEKYLNVHVAGFCYFLLIFNRFYILFMICRCVYMI